MGSRGGGGWRPFSSPGVGASAAERIEAANVQAGLGTDAERAAADKKKKHQRIRRQKLKAAAQIQELGIAPPMYQDPRFIAGALILTALVGGVWYSKSQKKKGRRRVS